VQDTGPAALRRSPGSDREVRPWLLAVRTADGFRTREPSVAAGSEVRIVADAALCKDPRLAAESDPRRAAIVRTEPSEIRARPRQPVIGDQRVQLAGWNFPDRVRFGQPFERTLFYRMLAPLDQPWKVFVHFDSASGRAGRADHEPVAGRCPTSAWQPGEIIVDRFTAQIDAGQARRSPAGPYRIWIGLFTGRARAGRVCRSATHLPTCTIRRVASGSRRSPSSDGTWLRYTSAMPTGVIDIGTNTLLLLIVDDAMQPLVDLCRFGRLGKGLDATGRLAESAIANSLEICREYRRVLDEHGVARPIVVATQAAREAVNAADFVGPAEQILNAPIQVIAGVREAELAALAVARTFPELAVARYLVVDVGGGSTEMITVDRGRVTAQVSIPIGAVRLTERHLRHDPPIAPEIAALTADIDRHLAALVLPRAVPVIGTAGTATTLAAIKLGLDHYDPVAVTGLRLSRDAVAVILGRLLASPVAERKKVPGIEPERADVIAAGAAIFAAILQWIDATVLITCDRGIRWGLAYEAMSTGGPAGASSGA
jgi:exopolyphosphatase/guanosine-5'-triphosphate,3'-diphosphate pyrophosphatase